jgi:hypothetical protein
MKVLEQSESKDKKKSIMSLLALIFPNHNPVITPNGINLINLDTKQTSVIDNNNFEIFRNVFKEVFCCSSLLTKEV